MGEPNLIEDAAIALVRRAGLLPSKIKNPKSRKGRDIRRIVWLVAHRELGMSFGEIAERELLGARWSANHVRDAIDLECRWLDDVEDMTALARSVMLGHSRPTWEDAERAYFEGVASRHETYTGAAEEAGISRGAMRRRLDRLGISLSYKVRKEDTALVNTGPEIIDPKDEYEEAMVATMGVFGVPMCRCLTNERGAPQARWALFLAMEDAGMDEREIAEIEFFGRKFSASSVLRSMNRGTEECDDPFKGPRMLKAKKAAAEALAGYDGQSAKSA